MLPTTLARGRATARGYGELLTMLNPTAGTIPGLPGLAQGLNTFRYSPYTIPTAAGSAAAAAAAAVAAAANSPQLNSAVPPSSVLNAVTAPVVSVASQVGPASQLTQHHPHAAQPAPQSHHQSSPLLPITTSAGASLLTGLSGLFSQAAQQPQQQQHHQQQQQLSLQQLQLLGLVGALPPQPAAPTVQTTSAQHHVQQHTQQQNSTVPHLAVNGGNQNQNHLAAQILALNNQAVAAAAAVNAAAVSGPCKQRATALPNNFALAAAANSNNSNQNQHHQHHAAHQPSSINGLNYSMNDLINLQGLQAFDASAANFQVPVGL